jgi:hypothetical protein
MKISGRNNNFHRRLGALEEISLLDGKEEKEFWLPRRHHIHIPDNENRNVTTFYIPFL